METAMTALAELGTETIAAIKAADRHGKTATTAGDHGAAIWLAHGRDGGRLTPDRTDDRCQWRLVDGKTITGHVGTVSANDGKTGAALALAGDRWFCRPAPIGGGRPAIGGGCLFRGDFLLGGAERGQPRATETAGVFADA